MIAKTVILIQKGTFDENIILLIYPGKARITFPFPMMELVILVRIRFVFEGKKLDCVIFCKELRFLKCLQWIEWDFPLQILNYIWKSECCAHYIQTYKHLGSNDTCRG
jgi:hypothetical protein